MNMRGQTMEIRFSGIHNTYHLSHVPPDVMERIEHAFERFDPFHASKAQNAFTKRFDAIYSFAERHLLPVDSALIGALGKGAKVRIIKRDGCRVRLVSFTPQAKVSK